LGYHSMDKRGLLLWALILAFLQLSTSGRPNGSKHSLTAMRSEIRKLKKKLASAPKLSPPIITRRPDVTAAQAAIQDFKAVVDSEPYNVQKEEEEDVDGSDVDPYDVSLGVTSGELMRLKRQEENILKKRDKRKKAVMRTIKHAKALRTENPKRKEELKQLTVIRNILRSAQEVSRNIPALEKRLASLEKETSAAQKSRRWNSEKAQKSHHSGNSNKAQ